MRLAPAVAAGTMRESPVPIELGGYRIPAGVPLFVAIHGEDIGCVLREATALVQL